MSIKWSELRNFRNLETAKKIEIVFVLLVMLIVLSSFLWGIYRDNDNNSGIDFPDSFDGDAGERGAAGGSGSSYGDFYDTGDDSGSSYSDFFDSGDDSGSSYSDFFDSGDDSGSSYGDFYDSDSGGHREEHAVGYAGQHSQGEGEHGGNRGRKIDPAQRGDGGGISHAHQYGEDGHGGNSEDGAKVHGQGGAEAAEQSNEDEGAQPRYAPHLVLHQTALPLRANESAYEKSHEKWVDVGEVH